MTRPARHRVLHRIGSALSDRDQRLLRLLGSSRFATTRQLARFLAANHTSAASALRQTSRSLKQLHDQKFVVALERRIGGARAGSTGLIWALTPLGHRLLDAVDGKPVHRRYRPEEEPFPGFLEHTLAVTETHLTFSELDVQEQIRLIRFETEPTCWRSYLGAGGITTTLKPDAKAVLAIGQYQDWYFLEIDRGTEALIVVVRKCLQYQAYRRSGLEQRTSRVFPAVLWVTHTRARADAIRERLAAEKTITPGLFTVVPIDDLRAAILAGPVSTEP
jgi:hypothetical protein